MAGNTRTTGLEQYYTPDGVALALTRFFIDIVGADPTAEWIEPAAGAGAFVRAARTLGVRTITALDIAPRGDGIAQADFLDEHVGVTARACITNPPFGRNHSLSVPFFNKLARSCDVIGFIVPRSWRKWSVVNRLDPNFVKIADWDLTVSYVDQHGAALTTSTLLNTVFQVWARSDALRPKLPHPAPPRVLVRATPEAADVAITQFGRGCGSVRTIFDRRPNTTQLYLTAAADTIADLQQLDLSPFYTQVAYIEALSQVEIEYALHAHRSGQILNADLLTRHTLASHPRYVIPEHLRTGDFDRHTLSASAI
jgi:predicted RNA methylase